MPDPVEAASRDGWRRAGALGEQRAAQAAIPVRITGHARRLASHAAGRWPAPDAVQVGYWPTLCLTWSAPAREIEIHEDRFELYRFGPRATEISDWCCGPGDAAPTLLDDLLHATFGEAP